MKAAVEEARAVVKPCMRHSSARFIARAAMYEGG